MLSSIRRPVFLLSMMVLVGCTTVGRPRGEVAAGLPSAYPTVEDAALAAFADVQARTPLSERLSVAVGTIRSQGRSFAYSAPQRSASLVGRDPARLRLELHGDDVAQYVVYPRTGHAEVDRANRSLARSLRDFLERRDPLHRPIYLLNSRGRVIVYGVNRNSVELGSLRDLLEEGRGTESGSALAGR